MPRQAILIVVSMSFQLSDNILFSITFHSGSSTFQVIPLCKCTNLFLIFLFVLELQVPMGTCLGQ